MSDGNGAPTTESPKVEATPENPAPKRDLSLLAAEYFGDEYHGEAAEPEIPAKVEAEVPEVEAVEETTDAPADDSDIAEQIRQLFDQDPSLLTKVKFGTKVDGLQGEATLDDLVRSYQTQTAAEKRLEDGKAKAAEILAEANAKAAKLGERFAEAVGLIESLESDLADDIKSAGMDKLRVEDPAEWAAKNAEFDKRKAKILQRRQDAAAKYHKANQHAQEEARKAFETGLREEMNALFERRPEWRDPAAFKAEGSKMSEFLRKFRQNTAQAVVHNHELFDLAHKARLYDELQANTNAAKKKLATVPKVLKPGTPKPPDQVSREKVNALASKARKSGSIDDAYALLKARRSK